MENVVEAAVIVVVAVVRVVVKAEEGMIRGKTGQIDSLWEVDIGYLKY